MAVAIEYCSPSPNIPIFMVASRSVLMGADESLSALVECLLHTRNGSRARVVDPRCQPEVVDPEPCIVAYRAGAEIGRDANNELEWRGGAPVEESKGVKSLDAQFRRF